MLNEESKMRAHKQFIYVQKSQVYKDSGWMAARGYKCGLTVNGYEGF